MGSYLETTLKRTLFLFKVFKTHQMMTKQRFDPRFKALICRKSKANYQFQLYSWNYNNNGHHFILLHMEGDNVCKHFQSN